MGLNEQDAEAVAREELDNAIADAASGGPPGHHRDVYALVDAYREAVRAAADAEVKARCIAALEDLPSYVVPTRSAQFEIEEAIRNA